MFKSSARQRFLPCLLLLCASSCGLWRSTNDPSGSNSAATAPPGGQTKTGGEIPFSTKEPARYRAEIVTRNFSPGGEKTERKIQVARDGARRLTVFSPGEAGSLARLETDTGAVFLIHHAAKIYAELSRGGDGAAPPLPAEAAGGGDFLTSELLNRRIGAAFENLGAEDNLTKFRVRLPASGAQAAAPAAAEEEEQTASEILVYFDEVARLPVRQEFYSLSGGQRALVSSVELRDFKAEIADALFEPPKDYRQVTEKEFQEILWKERTKNE